MKRAFFWSFTIALVTAAAMAASAQSSNTEPLGDYARAAKKSKPAVKSVSKVYDNDNLPRTTSISTVGNATEATPEENKDKKDAETATGADSPDAKADAEKDKAKAAEEKKKAQAEMQKKLDGQKQKIDLLSRELNVMQREYQVRAAAFYADAGNRLRNAAQWDSEDSKYKQQIADKQKALDDAKSQLGDMQEQARKAGVPKAAEE